MPYVNKVRELYKEILIDIRDHCFNKKYFIYDQANRLTNYIIDKYKVFPEFLWEKYPYFGIFRNQKNNKWFALVTNIDRSKLENGSGEVEVLNIKLGEDIINLYNIVSVVLISIGIILVNLRSKKDEN